jgi:NADPH2:quinone reductase
MRAALITQYGQPPRIGDGNAPAAGEGCAVVATTAAPITPLDILCATGTSYFGAPSLPYIPGVQGVGVVRHSARFSSGTRVWFPTTAGMAPGDGSMAELVRVPEGELVSLQVDVEDAVVAALGLSAVAAWMALTLRGRLRPGEQVLVLGAGGVVGQVAVQAARILGARRVVAACRSESAQQRARVCGADEVVLIRDDDQPDDLLKRMAAATDGGFDVVIDPLCGAPATAAAACLAARGRLVNLGSTAGPTASFSSAGLRSKSAEVLGYTNSGLTTGQREHALHQVLVHAAAGHLSVAHECVTIDGLPAAWARQAAGEAKTRIVALLPTG